MATQNPINTILGILADGWEMSAGTILRKFKLTGGDVTVVGGNNAVVTFPKISASLFSTADEWPNGVLIDGMISVTGTGAGGVKVSILNTYTKGDPTPTNPVYLNLNGTLYSANYPVVVVVPTGTNWFNMGSNILNNNEVDLFVYGGYNAATGVVVGFSRIPWGNQYSDFNTTSTNEQYMALSYRTGATGTDPYAVIGRFASTLVTGSNNVFQWNLPAYSPNNLVQGPIFETRILSFLPSVDTTAGRITSLSSPVAGLYQVTGRKMFHKVFITIGTNGTAAGGIRYYTPFISSQGNETFSGREANVGGKMLQGLGNLSSNAVLVYNYDNTYPGNNSAGIAVTGWIIVG